MRGLFQTMGLLVLAMLAVAWSPLAEATFGCEIQPVLPVSADVNANGSTTFSFQIVDTGGCPGTVSGTIAVATSPTDTTGGAFVSTATFSVNSPFSTPFTFTATAGPNGGGTATIDVNCSSCFNGPTSTQFFLNTNNVYSYTATTPGSVTTNQVRDFTLGTNLLVNGSGAGATYGTDFFNITTSSSLGTVPHNGAGNASLTTSILSANTYSIHANVQCPTALPNCPPPFIPFTVVVEPVSVTAVSPSLVTLPTPVATTLEAKYASASLAAPVGSTVTWSITGSPGGGDGALSGATTTDALGHSTVNFSASVPGTYTVTANSGCTWCADSSEPFTVTVTAVVRTISIVSGDGQTHPTGSTPPTTSTLVVETQDNGSPAAGITVNWFVSSGDATVSAPSSVTGAGGTTGVDVSFGPTPGPIVITATRADDGTAVATFNLTSTLTRTLSIVSGDGQSGPTDAILTGPLVVLAQDNGANANGVTINWSVSSGDASVSTPTLTGINGQSANAVTFGSVPGPVIVTATRSDDVTAMVTFNLTSTLTRTLTVVSGNGQVAAPSAPLGSPLVVEAKNNGSPVGGVLVDWSVTSGSASLSNATTTTSGAGTTSITATMGASPGAVVITASRQDDATVTAVFTLSTVSLAGLPGLDDSLLDLADALDAACAAVASLSSPSPEQLDLIARCQELLANAASNPGDVIEALEELAPDSQAAQGRAALLMLTGQFDSINARIAALRSGTQGSSFGGLALNTPTGALPVGSLFQALVGDAGPEAGADFDRWGLFVSGTIGRGDSDPTTATPGFDYSIHDLTIGVDYRRSDQFIYGAAVGYSDQGADLDGAQGGFDATGLMFSAYGTYYRDNSWYADAVLTFGRYDYDVNRRIQYTIPAMGGGFTTVDQTARGSSDGDMLSFGATFGRDFQKDAWSIGPYGRLLYTRLQLDRMVETLVDPGPGSGLGLVVEGREINSLASVLGVKFAYAHSTEWGVLMPHFQLEWEHEFDDGAEAVNAHFSNDPTGTPFVIEGAPVDRDFFRLGLGLSMVFAQGRSGFFYYERHLSRDGVSQDNLALGLRIEF
jgi:uncharacterized protein with beta-barrel porin domain